MMNSLDELIKELKEKGKIKFRIKVNAGSRLDSIDFCEDSVRIKVKAPAVDGKANKAIIEYLSEITDVQKSKIKILNGEKSSQKTISIEL